MIIYLSIAVFDPSLKESKVYGFLSKTNRDNFTEHKNQDTQHVFYWNDQCEILDKVNNEEPMPISTSV